MSITEKIQAIDYSSGALSVRQQCQLLRLNRSTLYFKPQPISQERLYVMNLIDELYTEQPSRGYRQMALALTDYDVHLNNKTVLSIMNKMGLKSISPGPHTSKTHPDHKIYPYLLKGYRITKPFQVWGADITYVRMQNRYAYLVAILDWYSRFVLSWRLSYSLSNEFCIEALCDALNSGSPDIFNTDQGAQFTSDSFIDLLKTEKIAISMDGKGSFWDNIFTERLWRTIKHDEIYPKEYACIEHAKESLEKYIYYYNFKRHHSSLNNKPPYLIHFEKLIPRPDLAFTMQGG